MNERLKSVGAMPGSGLDLDYERPGFLDATVASAKDQWMSYSIGAIRDSMIETDPNYKAIDHLSGWEPYFDDLMDARSDAEMQARKQRILWGQKQQQIIAESTWGEGWWSLVPGLVGSMADPTTYIPLPIAKGVGFIKGSVRWGAGNMALTAAAEGTRFQTDPNFTVSDYAITVGASGLLGGMLGGAAGAFGRPVGSRTRLQQSLDQAVADLDDMEGMSFARQLTESETGMKLHRVEEVGDGSGRDAAVVSRNEIVRLKEYNDEMYYYDERVGQWIKEIDRGASVDEIQPVSREIQDALGLVETRQEDVIEVKEVKLRDEYQGKTEQGQVLREGIENAEFRNADEWVTFNLLEAVWRKRLPDADDAQIQKEALEELKTSRVAPTAAGWAGKILDKLNRSPVAKAIRVFAQDQDAGNLALMFGGDYGWSVTGNRFGYKTPQSLLVQTTKHSGRFYQLRSEIDKQWMRYLSEGRSEGTEVQGMNINAQLSRLKRGGDGQLTYHDFGEMVSEAIIKPDEDFQINGHTVVPEAREAAKAVRKTLNQYEREARELGVFKNSQQVKKDIEYKKGFLSEIQAGFFERAYRRGQNPIKAAIRYAPADVDPSRHKLYVGDNMVDVRDQMKADLGAELTDAYLDNLPDGAMGFVRQQGSMRSAADIEDAVDKLTKTTERRDLELQVKEASEEAALQTLRGWRQLNRDWFSGDDRVPSIILSRTSPDTEAGYYNVVDNYIAINWKKWERQVFREGDDWQLKLLLEEPKAMQKVWDWAVDGATEVFLHETVHFMRAKGYLSVPEWDNLKRQADAEGWIEQFNIEARYVDLYGDELRKIAPNAPEAELQAALNDMLYEEAIAEAMKTQGLKAQDPETRTLLLDLKKKITDFIASMMRRITDTHNTFEIDSIETLFEKMTTGQMTLRMPDGEVSTSVFADIFTPGRSIADEADLEIMSFDDAAAEAMRGARGGRRRFLNDRLAFVHEVQGELDELLEIQRQLKENPNRFNNGENGIENYFPRIYDTFAIAARREEFHRMATVYFGGDDAARERADEWINAILSGEITDARLAEVPGFRSLNSRNVNWPNSYSIVDPEFGEIKLTDFMNTNVFTVMEQYTRRMGMKIESARMFGDTTGKKAIDDTKAKLLDRYITDDMDDKQVAVQMDRINEWENHIKNTRDLVMGSVRRSDPWRLDNRSARALKNWSQLAMMGRVALTSIPEVMRPLMVAGARAAWGSLFEMMSNTFDTMKFNRKWTRSMAAETNDLARDMFNARFAEMQRGEATGRGGTKFERMLEDAVPWLYKMNGLTAMTSFLKDWTMLAAQHSIMIEAREVANAVSLGRQPPAKVASRLAALGIGKREALLLAEMPVDTGKSGLILPAIQNWQGQGGEQAKKLLLDAIIGESRRSIVTPSVADKAMMFSGVVTRSTGERIGESDWASVPLQFMGYSVGANQKVLMSALQGRDRSIAMGIFAMMFAAYLSNYLKTPENAWRQKDIGEKLVDAYESSGLGALVLGDANLMMERYTNHAVGLRPALGMDPKFGRRDADSPIDVAGPGPSMLFDLGRVFWDDSMNATQQAQAIRRTMILQNYPLWAGFTRNLATDIGETFKE